MNKVWSSVIGILTGIVILAIGFLGFCVSINIHEVGFWILLAVAIFVAIFISRIAYGKKDFGYVTVSKRTGSKGRSKKTTKFNFSLKAYIVPLVIICFVILVAAFSSPLFNANRYASVLEVSQTEFKDDISESVGTDSIALMDTASARMLGDREIGSLSNVVSQFNVSDDFSQIDYQGKPIKVSALEYAGFFKWVNNRRDGTCGYVTVDPVSMTASYVESKGMKYIPSAYFFDDTYRHMWLKYPTTMFGNVHFEIDEEGKPFYIASTYKKAVGLFNALTVDGCIILDPVTGEMQKYSLNEVPKWVDIVFYGDLLCTQYNWNGKLQNGYLNSLIGKKGCKQITTYYDGVESEETDSEDVAPICDYGYVSKDGDIWIYTGITSLNGDSSNIGFLLANERTGESHYFPIAGADEKSAMASAEGEVQEKGYQASFPALINVCETPTYIMVLKDAGGLVKQYAAVNVEQYNIVATANTQAECISKYKALLGINEEESEKPDSQSALIKIADIKYIDINGYTYIYLIDEKDGLYKAKASSNEQMLLLKKGDEVQITYSGNTISSCKKK